MLLVHASNGREVTLQLGSNTLGRSPYVGIVLSLFFAVCCCRPATVYTRASRSSILGGVSVHRSTGIADPRVSKEQMCIFVTAAGSAVVVATGVNPVSVLVAGDSTLLAVRLRLCVRPPSRLRRRIHVHVVSTWCSWCGGRAQKGEGCELFPDPTDPPLVCFLPGRDHAFKLLAGTSRRTQSACNDAPWRPAP
jgi:hypothetical protein